MFLNKLRKRKGVFDKVHRSIRTRYSLATAFVPVEPSPPHVV